jgi:hypothetical protein
MTEDETRQALSVVVGAVGGILERHGVPPTEFADSLRAVAGDPGQHGLQGNSRLVSMLLTNVADALVLAAPVTRN